MILHNASIKQKLEAIILATTAAVLLPSILLFMSLEIVSARDNAITRFQSLATVLGANSSAAIAFRDEVAATEVINSLASQDDVIWAGINRLNKTLFVEYQSEKSATLNQASYWQSTLEFLLGRIEVSEAISFDGEVIGELLIIGDLSRLYITLINQSVMGLGIFAASMLAALLLSGRLQRVVSVPVNELLNTMQTVATHRDFNCRAKRLSNDELGTLVDGFNDMLQQIQTDDNELRTYRQELERLVIERTHELETSRAQAEAANRAKSLFLASMSHEIRTPMNGVLGMIQVLRGTTLSDEQQHYIDTLDSSSKNLLLLIDDVLDLSKIESGKLVLDIETFKTFNWITDIQNIAEPLFENKKTQFITNISEQLPASLKGDATRLLQIVINLISNAAKCTPEGEVTLSIGGQLMANNQFNLQISVSDTGIGIQAEKLNLIFDAFQQLEINNITNNGVGLGLAICKRLTDFMSGNLQVTSTPGKGSCFKFDVTMPVADENSHLETTENALLINRKLSILLVDDDAINRFAARTLLEQTGQQVIEAENGQLAIEATQKQSFDIILMDIHMPVVDGITATQTIRQSSHTNRNTAIIGVTASVMTDEKDRYLNAGMNAVVEKPIMINKLMKTINSLINK